MLCIKNVCGSLDNQMKELSSKGIGVQVRKAKPFYCDEEETLWQTDALGKAFKNPAVTDWQMFLHPR